MHMHIGYFTNISHKPPSYNTYKIDTEKVKWNVWIVATPFILYSGIAFMVVSLLAALSIQVVANTMTF